MNEPDFRIINIESQDKINLPPIPNIKNDISELPINIKINKNSNFIFK